MKSRLNLYEAAPEQAKQAANLQKAIDSAGVDQRLLELIKIRVSQINGCAFCLNQHSADALKHGETQNRIFVLPGWRESTLYSEKERAALAWADILTHVSSEHGVEAAFNEMKRHFSDLEIGTITSEVAMMNYYNRIAVGLGYVSPLEQREERDKSQG